MINYGDICKIDGRAVEAVDCVIGGSPCFPADTPVLTLNGYKPIQDIVVGDLVFTHEGRYREVLDTGSHVDSLVRLSDGVHEILCTENHPFRSMDSDYKIDWTPARDMVGMSWLYLEDGPGYPCEWIKVLLCERTDSLCEVFNLEVDEDNSYVANHLVVHNCQNLSIAGNKLGLEGNESRLFLEQMRLIREMRQASGFTKPRYMVWENVCNALSCSKGRDFQRVLNECVHAAMFGKIKEDINGKDKEYEMDPTIPDVPMPKDGKWPKSGMLYDDMGRWSLAWRVHDAQYWGVAQRRRRIALVVDFGGMSAPEVLFEQQSMSGNLNQGDAQGEGTSKAFDGSPENSDYIWDARGNGSGNLCSTLTGDHDNRITDYTNVVVEKEELCLLESDRNSCETYSSFCINGDAHESGMSCIEEISHTLKVTTKEVVAVHEHRVKDEESWLLESDQNQATGTNTGVQVPTVTERDHRPIVIDRAAFNQGENAMFNPHIKEEEIMATLVAKGPHAVCCPSNEVYSVHENDCQDIHLSKTADPLTCGSGKPGQSYPCICIGNGQAHVTQHYTEEVSQTLNCMHDPMTILEPVVSPKDSESSTSEDAGTCGNPSCNQGGTDVVETSNVSYKVRRLTPLECTRLQGFPDHWVDIGDWVDSKGKKHKDADSPKYKALGNSIALPFWKWLCRNIVGELRKSGQSTLMASLFDGIGGFPLCWSEATGNQDDVLWISEIEEFPIAVTRYHFGHQSKQ